MENKELNIFLQFLLIVSIVRAFIRIFAVLVLLGSYSDAYVISEIVILVFLIIALIGVLCKNRYFLIGLFLLGLCNAIVAFCAGNSNTGFVQLLILVLWAAALCLKKNGVSAWKTILGNQKAQNRDKARQALDEIIQEAMHSDFSVSLETGTECITNIEDKQEDTIIPNVISNKDSFQERPEEFVKEPAEEPADSGNNEESFQEEPKGPVKVFVEGPADSCNNEESLKEEPKESDKESADDSDNQRTNKPLSSKRRGLWKLIKYGLIPLVVLFFVFILVRGLLYSSRKPESRYEEARTMLKEKKYDEAIKILTDLANDNYLDAKCQLSYIYLIDPNYSLDKVEGLKYLEDAAKSDSKWIKTLIKIYSGRKKCKGMSLANDVELKKYAEIAIKKNIDPGYAYFELGNIYVRQQKYSNAYYYWQKAAEYDDYGAHRNLGQLFFNGLGGPVNYAKAKEHFLKAYDKKPNDVMTLFYLGLMHLHGYEFPVDRAKAKDFIKRAADLGLEEAQKTYAEMDMIDNH